MPVPNIFANQSGAVPASELDENFQYILDNVPTVTNPTAFSAIVRMVGHCFDTAKSVDIASAASLNLNDPQATSPGTCTGNFVSVTGTATITSVTLSSGAMRIIRAAGAFTWTNNASIEVTGGANYVAAAGDMFLVQGDAAGVVRVVCFPVSGIPIGQVPVATGISGLGAGVADWLATPSSANLRTAVTDETGTGALVFATSPTFTTPNIGAATGTGISTTGIHTARSGTATPAAASAVAALAMGSAGIGLYWGTGDPNTALTAPKGSFYLRTDGSSSSTRAYINSDGSTAWVNVTTSG